MHYPARIVASVHDLAFERYPRFLPPNLVTELRVAAPLTIRGAAAVLTLSEFSQNDIVRRYGVPPAQSGSRTHFEGFGLPPLEAMACGTPVLTSNTSSLPEVVDDAALMVDRLDEEAVAATIATALSNADLRARLSVQGLQRAKAFSWETTARTILGI